MKRAFERDRQVILLMGETGHSRLGEVRQELVQKAGLGERAVYRGVEACQEEGLIERRRGASVQGRPTDLVYLTEKGKWAYEQLSGKPARSGEFEMLLKAHKSRKHTSLILKTSDHFTRLGFLVEREPLRIKISENRYFQPDLVARKDGKAFYLEVESGERAERSSLLHKWENAFIAGGGRIYVVAPRPGVMNTVQSMILNWATENGRKPSLYLTHLEALKGCQPGDSPWVRIR
jgi:DNA-binding MarR family transcriptional regulator